MNKWLLLIVLGLVVPGGMSGAVFAQNAPAADDSATPAAAEDDATPNVRVFDHFVVQGGVITWVVLIPMSVAMMAMSIGLFLLIRRTRLMPPELREELLELIEQGRYRDALDLAADDPSMLGHLVHVGLTEAPNGRDATVHAIEEAMEERTAALFRRIEHLNVLGNVAPMVGLFGTVYGMIRAFHSLVETGGVPDPGRLALGISVALVTTFWGLLVAIPALSVYAVTRNRVDALAPECSLVAQDILRPLHRPAAAPAAASSRAVSGVA